MIWNEINGIVLEGKDLFEEIIGQESVKKQLNSAFIAGRNVVVIGNPGIGKTTLAKNIAKHLQDMALDDTTPWLGEPGKVVKGTERFVRVQGSPDLTAEDLLGDIDPLKALEFGPLSVEAFTPGKIFKAHNGILFFDEVNRCSEKLQNALLQVLQEKIVTIGSYDVDFPADFLFIGTMNPEDSSTEKLSDVFLDRFDMIEMHYPETLSIELEIVQKHGKHFDVTFSESLLQGMIYFVRKLREHIDVARKPSVRATLGLYERAQANALLDKVEEVTIEHIRDAVLSVLSHRLELKPSVKYLKTTLDFVQDEFSIFEKDHKSGKIKKFEQSMSSDLGHEGSGP